jgi:uncharacterized membrane protein
MDTRTEEGLARWLGAGLIDQTTAERIRQYELLQRKPAGARWQVTLALVFGGILLSSGVALFVAAHWDALSPWSRFSIVLALLAVFHLAADIFRPRFAALATVLHGVGTLGAGAAIFLVGQIFNIQEHWPGGILLWLLAALAGWLLLRDQVQETIGLLLLPTWVVSEWYSRASGYAWDDVFLGRMLAVLGALYLTAFLHSKKKLVAGFAVVAGVLAMLAAVPMLAHDGFGWSWNLVSQKLPLSLHVGVWLVLLVVMAWAAFVNRRSVVPVAVTFVWSMVLPYAHRIVVERPGTNFAYTYSEPSLLMYLLTAILTAFYAWYGVRQRSRLLINLGSAGFAATVLWFYFSDIMDKLGRSFSLIALGVLFLLGGWLLERVRRRLVGRISPDLDAKEAV